jgi:hypothetical protein
MSGHCPKCGDYHEEDDSRPCAKCDGIAHGFMLVIGGTGGLVGPVANGAPYSKYLVSFFPTRELAEHVAEMVHTKEGQRPRVVFARIACEELDTESEDCRE